MRGNAPAPNWHVQSTDGDDAKLVPGTMPASLPAFALQPRQLTNIPPALAPAVFAAAERYNLSPHLIDAVARQESGYRPQARSRVGAIGVMQLMPDTARTLGVDPRDPLANIDGGARYLRQQLDRFDGDVERALAAYNAGPNRVVRAGGVPRIAETKDYIAKILGRLAVAPASAARLATTAAGSVAATTPAILVIDPSGDQ